jgi:hypothetical protein
MSTITTGPETSQRHHRVLEHLIERHDELERLISERVSHGLSTTALWSALIAIENRVAEDFPRAHAFWIAQWAQPAPASVHAPGQHHPQCSICAQTPLGRGAPRMR